MKDTIIQTTSGNQYNYNVQSNPDAGKLNDLATSSGDLRLGFCPFMIYLLYKVALNHFFLQIMSPFVKLSPAGCPLSISRCLRLSLYKNGKVGLGIGYSNLKNFRIGVMGHLRCYGARGMVRLSLCLARSTHPHKLLNSWCWKDYPCVRTSSTSPTFTHD